MPPHCAAASSSSSPPRPRFEVGDIARDHAGEVLEQYAQGSPERRVLAALMTCRTAALGGHLDRCSDCGHERPSYNSCRNRHCPKCQALAQHRWLEARRQRLLPVHHFHVVFTLPAELRDLVSGNRRRLFDLLFRAAADTLLELGRDPRWLGAQLGVTAVLHTWSRDLSWHPHLHCVVTGGGLDPEGHWRATRKGFLFPVRVLGRLFRGKVLDALRRLRAERRLRLDGPCAALRDPLAMDDLMDRLHRKHWLVYCKPPFGDTDAVYAYLGRYTHRIGISNRRLLRVDPERVTFRTRHAKQASFPPRVFLRRLLRHVLPPGYVRIRHYGLLASANVHGALERARQQLQPACPPRAAPEPPASAGAHDDPLVATVHRITGLDLRACPVCRKRTMQLRADPLPIACLPRPPPGRP